jgi:hypothetical protein
LISNIFLFSQGELKYIDTTLDYKERFYKDGKLNTNYDYGTATNYEQAEPVSKKVKVGLCVEYFDRKMYEADETKYTYYRLVEYVFGETEGKIYYFKKNDKLAHVVTLYPKIKDSIYEGYRIIYYKKDRIELLDYRRFDDVNLKGIYVYSTSFYPDGQVKSHVLSDDDNYQYQSWQFNKAGFCTNELKLNNEEAYRIKRKGRKEIVEIRENEKHFKILKIDGVEIKRKKFKDHKEDSE